MSRHLSASRIHGTFENALGGITHLTFVLSHPDTPQSVIDRLVHGLTVTGFNPRVEQEWIESDD